MEAVFTSVMLWDGVNTQPTGTINLLEDFMQATEEQVALSCVWYNRVPVDRKPYQQDLQATFEYLRNNTSEALELKVMESYNDFPFEQQGGHCSSS